MTKDGDIDPLDSPLFPSALGFCQVRLEFKKISDPDGHFYLLCLLPQEGGLAAMRC